MESKHFSLILARVASIIRTIYKQVRRLCRVCLQQAAYGILFCFLDVADIWPLYGRDAWLTSILCYQVARCTRMTMQMSAVGACFPRKHFWNILFKNCMECFYSYYIWEITKTVFSGTLKDWSPIKWLTSKTPAIITFWYRHVKVKPGFFFSFSSKWPCSPKCLTTKFQSQWGFL